MPPQAAGRSPRPKARERLLQDRRARRVPVGEPDRQPLKEEIGRTRRLRRRGAGERGLAHLHHAGRRGPAGRRTSPRTRPPGRSRAPGRGRPPRARGRPRSRSGGASLPRLEANAICARSRCTRARSEVVDGAGLGGGQQSESVVERARFVLGLRRRQAPAARGARARVSARPRARETRRRRPDRPAPGRDRPPARARRRRPRRGRPPPRPDARRAGRDRPARRSPRPTPGAPAAAPAATPPGRPPSARADDETAPWPSISIRPADSAGSSTGPAIPSRSAARHNERRITQSAPPPPPSKSRWVSSGSASSRFRKLSSIRPGSDSAPGNPNPPASCAGESPRGSSNNANGLPRVSATSWSATRSSSRPGITDASSARASASPKTLDHQLRQAREQIARLARGEQHHHRLRQQPARHEHHRLRRGAVQPLRVVDHAQQRPLLRGLREQAQHRQADEEPVRHRAGTQVRTWSRAPRAADPEADRAGRASARTTDAAPRTRAPSPTPPPPPAAPADPTPTRSRSRAAPSSRCPPHPAPPAPRSTQPAPPSSSRSSTAHSSRRPRSISPPEQRQSQPWAGRS